MLPGRSLLVLACVAPCVALRSNALLRSALPDVGVASRSALLKVGMASERAMVSGLAGKAMLVAPEDIPTKAEVRKAVPAHCFERDTLRSLFYAVQSTAVTAVCMAAGFQIPLKITALPLWVAYAAVTGTAATGMWVVAHECGHGAFSDNRKLQDAVGYLLHSILMVPYFSWQRSHAVHHSRTNHITEGETHVPVRRYHPNLVSTVHIAGSLQLVTIRFLHGGRSSWGAMASSSTRGANSSWRRAVLSGGGSTG